MSLNLLNSNYKKEWLNPVVNDLTCDRNLDVKGVIQSTGSSPYLDFVSDIASQEKLTCHKDLVLVGADRDLILSGENSSIVSTSPSQLPIIRLKNYTTIDGNLTVNGNANISGDVTVNGNPIPTTNLQECVVDIQTAGVSKGSSQVFISYTPYVNNPGLLNINVFFTGAILSDVALGVNEFRCIFQDPLLVQPISNLNMVSTDGEDDIIECLFNSTGTMEIFTKDTTNVNPVFKSFSGTVVGVPV